MTDISERRTSKTRTLTPLPWAPGEKIDFGACKSLKVTCVSEIGWADNRDMMQDISSGGGLAASQSGVGAHGRGQPGPTAPDSQSELANGGLPS